MKQQLTRVFVVATVLAAGTAGAAEDGLQTRAMSALGSLLASQGNVALLEIQAEMKRDLLDTLRPLLPPAQPDSAPADDREQTPSL